MNFRSKKLALMTHLFLLVFIVATTISITHIHHEHVKEKSHCAICVNHDRIQNLTVTSQVEFSLQLIVSLISTEVDLSKTVLVSKNFSIRAPPLA